MLYKREREWEKNSLIEKMFRNDFFFICCRKIFYCLTIILMIA